MRILVVDDEPLILDTIEPFLARCGHQAIGTSSVDAATAAISRTDGAIDLVITDICMPGGSGTQLLHKVRNLFPGVDVLLMTAHSAICDLRQAVEEGAVGLMRKPIKLDELRLLVDQISASRSDRITIRRMEMSLDTEKNLRAAMTRERMFARRLHQRIFPSDFSWLRHTDVALRHLPQAGLGGDYMDVRADGQGQVLLFVADVSGHGTPAAFGGIALRTWFSSLEAGVPVAEILARADSVMRELFPGEYYATAFCARYDEASRELVYASAGHPAPLVCSATTGFRKLEAEGSALGVAADGEREMRSTTLADGEVLLAYTDGLSEDLYPIACTHGQRCLTQLGQASTDLTGVLTGAIDMATSAVPLHAFADDISLLALRPRTALPPERHVIVAGKRVLHIDDDPIICTLIGHVLTKIGITATSCSTAAAARLALAEQQPDLVILDLGLPDALGHDLFRSIRRLHPHLPVLVVTGNAIDSAARQCFDLNPAGILTKPVDVREFERAFRYALQFDPDRDLVAFDNLGNEWFDFVISSSPAAVELLTRYLQALARQPLPSGVLDDLVWSIREMAMNGIEWGNRFAPELTVRVSTLIMPDRVMVKIADEGSGFDTHRLFDSFDPLHVSALRERAGKRCGGFGLAMVQARMTRVEFNQRGNVVLMVKNFIP